MNLLDLANATLVLDAGLEALDLLPDVVCFGVGSEQGTEPITGHDSHAILFLSVPEDYRVWDRLVCHNALRVLLGCLLLVVVHHLVFLLRFGSLTLCLVLVIGILLLLF